jgi:hypothetical protein
MILRAKKRHILPVTSAGKHSRHQTTLQKSGASPLNHISMDNDAIQRLLRPSKRTVDIEGEDLDSLFTFTGPQILPPIGFRDDTAMVREGESEIIGSQKKVRLEQSAQIANAPLHSMEYMDVVTDTFGNSHHGERHHNDYQYHDEIHSASSRTMSTKRSYFRTELDETLAIKKFSDPFEFIEYLQSKTKSKDFVYLNMRRHLGRASQISYNPYDLEIVDYVHVDKKKGYYTLSISVRIVKSK